MQQICDAVSASQIEALKVDRSRGEIIIRCLTDLFSMLFWRCWGDKVLFKCTPLGDSQTEVEIFGIPNWFRLGVKKGEKVYNRDELAGLLEA